MKGTFRGRSFCIAFWRLAASSLATATVALGCAGAQPAADAGAAARPQPPADAAAKRGTAAERGAAAEEREQREAQRAWCVYLDALYRRASEHEATWPKFQECTQITTLASPTMLRTTAECSLRALERFDGDPFTNAYAAEVGRCGTDAMTASALSRDELAPYMTALCGRTAGCGDVDFITCWRELDESLGTQLGRAAGALSGRGRRMLQACFRGVSCAAIGPQISACLQPILDDLLWLPR